MPDHTSQQAFFTKVPHSVHRADISLAAKIVWIELSSHKKEFNPPLKILLENTKIKHPKTLLDAIAELEIKGFLVVKRCKGKRNSYVVHANPTTSENEPVNLTTSKNEVVVLQKMKCSTSKNEVVVLQKMKCASYIEDKNKNNNSYNNKDKNKPSPPKTAKSKKLTPKYTDQDRHAANQWHEYLKEHHPHHEKRIKILATAAAIQTLRLKEGVTYVELLQWQQLASEDEFWRSNLISLAGLVKKRWKNGTRAIDNLKSALDKRQAEHDKKEAFWGRDNVVNVKRNDVKRLPSLDDIPF